MPCGAIYVDDDWDIEAHCHMMDQEGIPCEKCPYYESNEENQKRISKDLEKKAKETNWDDIPF